MKTKLYKLQKHTEIIDSKNKIEPRHEKTCLQGFRPWATQKGLYSHRKCLETSNFDYLCSEKNALISCAFVLAHAKIWFSHDADHKRS